MPKVLTSAQVEQFRRDGYVHPIRLMSEAQAGELRARLEAYEASTGGPLQGDLRHKAHLVFAWLADLVHHDVVVSAVEDLYGPDLFCWSSTFFIKEPRNPSFVSWHQDSTYWGLNRADVVTAWIALSPSTKANGAMEVIPGTHTLDQIPHRDTFAKDNMLTRGQEVAVEVDASKAVTIELQPGEMSLHHVLLVHGSAPNPSPVRRVGFAARYIPTSVRQLAAERDSATLVRGRDAYGHFEHEPRPARDLDPACLALHREITARNARILYRGTAVPDFNAARRG
ncbi:MAG: phytanoyl-CoA dioxygenase family protein [Verrucomicrobia bacterium]|nr:phytanoyl-CoA dioxygenase family protein [Verrucomicrobiota bacterium]